MHVLLAREIVIARITRFSQPNLPRLITGCRKGSGSSVKTKTILSILDNVKQPE